MNKIEKELCLYSNPDFKLGEYIYMGMAKLKGKTVVISIAYKIDYCITKARQFEKLTDNNLVFYKINKVKVGELEAMASFKI